MIRVLQFGMSFNRGGIETFLFNYYKHLDHSKVQFDFVKSGSEKIPFEDEILEMGGRIYEFKACGIKKGYLRNRREWIRFFDDVKPDVVHFNTIALTSLYALMYAPRSTVRMIIAHAHPSTYSKGMLTLKSKILIKINKHFVNLFATDLWACSDMAGKWMFSRKFRIIPNAIDIRRFAFNENARMKMRNRLMLENKLVLCNVGNLSDVKNQVFLLDVFMHIRKKVSDAVLLLLGDGTMRKTLQEKALKLDILEEVLFMGNVQDVENYLSASDLFVFPSKSEGFGIALLEAQANGLRCFASADVIPAETNITGGITFLSLEKKAAYWAEKIVEELPIERLSQTELVRLKNNYDIEHCAVMLQNQYLRSFE